MPENYWKPFNLDGSAKRQLQDFFREEAKAVIGDV